MRILLRLLVASFAGLVAYAAAQAFWGAIEQNSYPTSQYVIDSLRFVNVASTLAVVLAAFLTGLSWGSQ